MTRIALSEVECDGNCERCGFLSCPFRRRPSSESQNSKSEN